MIGNFVAYSFHMRVLFFPFLLSLYASCSSDSPPPGTGQATATQGHSQTADATRERDRVQKPEVIIGMLGNGGDLTGITIADLFAEDGYFTFKMIEAGANVVAVVSTPEQAEALNAKKRDLALGDDRLQVRTALPGDPGIANAEVDMAFIAHHFVGIPDKATYFQRMRQGMRPPRYLMIVEWTYGQTATGPPLSERMSENDVMDFVGTTGYSDVGAHSAQIPDQTIYLINDYIDEPVEGVPTE